MTPHVHCGNCPNVKMVRQRRSYGRFSQIIPMPCKEHPCPMNNVEPAELEAMKIRFTED